MAGPLHELCSVAGRATSHVNALTTMDGHKRGRGSCDPKLLVIARRTGVLLKERAWSRGGACHFEALATMTGFQLEGVRGAHRDKLKLLVGSSVTTALHGLCAGGLRVASDLQTFLTMGCRQRRC